MFEISISLSPRKTPFGPLLFSGDLPKGLEVAASLGYSGVELSLLDSDTVDFRWLKDLLDAHRLKVFAIATGQTYYTEGYSLYSEHAEKRAMAVQRVKGHIRLGRRLESMVIIGGIRGKLSEGQGTGPGEEAVRQCAAYAEENGVTVLIEPINRYETNLVNTIDEAVALMDRIGGGNHLKLLPDTFHMNIEEASLEESLLRAGQRIGYIHFSDSNRQAPGLGHIDFAGVLAVLKRIGYAGNIGIEILPRPDDFTAAEQGIRHIQGIVAGP